MPTSNAHLPVAILGAGPVGLAAAAHLAERNIPTVVLERGASAGAAVETWRHVRMFSPWRYDVDPAARRLLLAEGWAEPDAEAYPTGADLLELYLLPLARTRTLASALRLDSDVVAVARATADRTRDAGRGDAPFVVRYRTGGGEHELEARAVIDASGTIATPGPLGGNGLPALGERALAGRIAYGLPDVLGAQRARYANRRVLVVGSGHSTLNALNDLARLQRDAPATEIHWVLRRPTPARALGGGKADQLPERGALGARVADLIERRRLIVHAGVLLRRVEERAEGLVAWARERSLPPVDEIIAATGFRPDHSFLDEVRVDVDPALQSARPLARLIDPNLHSCGTVPPHGAEELRQPEGDLYLAGMKSYGRAPTFLLLTGYEQVRSIAAELAGDHEAARRVELVLPATGVCGTTLEAAAAGGCCGGPAEPGVDACCVADAEAKSAGAAGCGCATSEPALVSISGRAGAPAAR